MGVDGSDAKGGGGVPPQSGSEDFRNDGLEDRGRRLGEPPVADAMEAAWIWLIEK